ncbi:hypothetical protein F441_08804 [Phytophthora nicotianae CJ01A1]|uniref:Uncharacterized protein n=2 Tax=Phytophthora nicotianae TaxID=4792 RepID=W2X3Y9_PHYNI|nr:hypothetical protein L916_08589 [Phytophthora nicotianae]ETP16639.1 hypothetical protein F441_08804 [Phytophthora nicotianae CJ01A1]
MSETHSEIPDQRWSAMMIHLPHVQAAIAATVHANTTFKANVAERVHHQGHAQREAKTRILKKRKITHAFVDVNKPRCTHQFT